MCDSEKDGRSDPVEQRGAAAAIRCGLAIESFETTALGGRVKHPHSQTNKTSFLPHIHGEKNPRPRRPSWLGRGWCRSARLGERPKRSTDIYFTSACREALMQIKAEIGRSEPAAAEATSAGLLTHIKTAWVSVVYLSHGGALSSRTGSRTKPGGEFRWRQTFRLTSRGNTGWR